MEKKAIIIRQDVYKKTEFRTCFSYTLFLTSPILIPVKTEEGDSYVYCQEVVCYLNPLLMEITAKYVCKHTGKKLKLTKFRTSRESFVKDLKNHFNVQQVKEINQLTI